MRRSLLEILICPHCGDELELFNYEEAANGEILEGRLECVCGKEYPIIRGVPRLLPYEVLIPHLQSHEINFLSKWRGRFHSLLETNCLEETDFVVKKRRTLESFGYEWKRFWQLVQENEYEFFDGIAPLTPSYLRGKLVLDVGCGNGRQSYYAAKSGARMVAIDLSEAVDVAYQNTRHVGIVEVIQGDIYHLPVKPVFDFVYSFGVVHHLPMPERGFSNLLSTARPGGQVLIWFYGKEGNWFMLKVIDPLRRLTMKMSLGLLVWVCLLPAGLLEFVTRLYVKLGIKPHHRLPYSEYIPKIRSYTFPRKHLLIFDFLSAPITHYYSKEELEAWCHRTNAKHWTLVQRNKNSWKVFIAPN